MNNRAKSADEFIPLTDLGYHSLVALAEDPLHGYALGKRISNLSDGRLRPTTGALYQLIRRYVEAGLLERVAAPEGMEGDARRQFFAITSLGRQVRIDCRQPI